MSHHSFAQATTRGVQTVIRLYPWSVLWVLFAIASILVAQGAWQSLIVIVSMVLVIAWHSIHRDHQDHPRTRGGRHGR
jgi:anaerobic C4-dicarboxylate transporter